MSLNEGCLLSSHVVIVEIPIVESRGPRFFRLIFRPFRTVVLTGFLPEVLTDVLADVLTDVHTDVRSDVRTDVRTSTDVRMDVLIISSCAKTAGADCIVISHRAILRHNPEGVYLSLLGFTVLQPETKLTDEKSRGSSGDVLS